MALILKDRVRETTTVEGTGTATLLGAVTGFQAFSAIGDTNTTYYAIVGQGTSEWEVGIGTFTLSGTTLARTTVLASSAGGTTKVTFSAGTKDVFCTYPAEKSVYDGGTFSININGTVGATTPAAGTFTTLFAPLLKGGLYKADPTTVVFTKTAAGTVSIKAGTIVATPNATLTFATATAVTMCALSAVTDYAIYACDDGALHADASFSYPSGYSASNSRKIGGFHYAPGGNATAQAGGDTTPAINEYSLWDVKFRPVCPDPRGKALIANGFWADIYLTGVDAITNGSSKYGVAYADGSSPPKIPACFGGNGSTAYATFNWWEANEMASAFGMRLPTRQEFMALAYGTTEATSEGTERHNTGLYAAYTSRWGIMQATGCLLVWGAMRAGPYDAAAAWVPATGTTASRGSEYNAPNAALFGGNWTADTNAGSRCSQWNYAASISSLSVGSRLVCNHYQED